MLVSQEIADRFPFLDFRKRDIRVKTDEVNALIPSDLFPLAKGRIRVFHSMNTGIYDDESLKDAFNSISFAAWRCYSNTESIIKAYKGLKAYAGWIIGTDGMILHHVWAAYEEGVNVHLLDGSISTSIYRYVAEGSRTSKDLDELRRYVADQLHREDGMGNAERAVYGVCPAELLYIGSQTAPSDGLAIWKELCRKYPMHPAYQLNGQNQYGKSRFQEIYREGG